MHPAVTLASIVALSLVCVLADYLLKCASQATHPFKTGNFALGAGLYGLSAIGWVWLFRVEKMATIGALYSSVVLIMLVGIGVIGFHERLSLSELCGIGCALAAVVLLSRLT